MKLLEELVRIPGTPGDESKIAKFIVDYVKSNQANWKIRPEILHGKGFQDAIVLVFGKPNTAVFAHLDTVGYTVGYENELIKAGGPKAADGTTLVGTDSKGDFECELMIIEDDEGGKKFKAVLDRNIERGTPLSYAPNFRETEEFIQSPYMDNRLGVWNALQVCETLENGAIVFSTYEEHGGGSVGFLSKFLFEEYNIHQALISDITWKTEGVQHGKGVAISMRDSGIPRRIFLNRIIELAKNSGIPYQLEVESAGGSDGTAIQKSPYPIDWLFIGAAEDNVHTPDEIVRKEDITVMRDMYRFLMQEL